jgi:hypothetical protein
MSQEINLDDPNVQRLLYGKEVSGLATGTGGKRKLAQMAGDYDQGVTAKTKLDATKHEVLVLYKKADVWLTVDVYPMHGEPTTIHLICPRCHHSLQISETRKKMEVDLFAVSPILRMLTDARDLDADDIAYLRAKGSTGVISVEPFECTWELGPGQLCRWKAAIDKNVVKEA